MKHPALLREETKRAASIQLRVADGITALAGSMAFVYIHVVAFAVWMTVFEQDPWPKLTLVVSLEAILLSTFILLSQNRQSQMAAAKADHDYEHQDGELKTNTELTQAVHDLTVEIHQRVMQNSERIDALEKSGGVGRENPAAAPQKAVAATKKPARKRATKPTAAAEK